MTYFAPVVVREIMYISHNFLQFVFVIYRLRFRQLAFGIFNEPKESQLLIMRIFQFFSLFMQASKNSFPNFIPVKIYQFTYRLDLLSVIKLYMYSDSLSSAIGSQQCLKKVTCLSNASQLHP